jgi:hypothetical protein
MTTRNTGENPTANTPEKAAQQAKTVTPKAPSEQELKTPAKKSYEIASEKGLPWTSEEQAEWERDQKADRSAGEINQQVTLKPQNNEEDEDRSEISEAKRKRREKNQPW